MNRHSTQVVVILIATAVGCNTNGPPYPTKKPLADVTAHANTTECVAFNGDGSVLVTGGGDKKIIRWDGRTGQQLTSVQAHRRSVGSLAFNPEGDLLVSAGDDSQVILWEANTLRKLRELALPTNGFRARSLHFSHDGKKLLGAVSRMATERTFGGCLVAWDVATGVCSVLDETAEHHPCKIALLNDRLFILYSNGQVVRRQMEVDSTSGRVRLGPTSIFAEKVSTRGQAMAASYQNGRLALAMQAGTIAIFDGKTGKALETLPSEPKTHGVGVNCVTFSKDGNSLVSVHGMTPPYFTVLRVWHGPNYSSCDAFCVSNDVFHATYHPAGSEFATGSSDGRAQIWDARYVAGKLR